MRLVSALLIGVVLAALSLYVDKQVRPVNLGWFENVNPDWPRGDGTTRSSGARTAEHTHWFACAPNTSAAYYPPRGDSHVFARVFVWCDAGALWLIITFSLRRQTKHPELR